MSKKNLAILLSFFFCCSAEAQVISVDFAGDNSGAGGNFVIPADVAGVIPVANWNGDENQIGTGSLSNLVDDNGAATSAAVTWFAANAWGGLAGIPNVTTGDEWMVNGWLDDGGSGADVQVTGIPYSFYDVYVYGSSDAGNEGSGWTTRVNGTDFFSGGEFTNVSLDGSFFASTVGFTNASTTDPDPSYFKINSLSGSTLSIFGARNTSGPVLPGGSTSYRGSVSGFQIVEITNPNPQIEINRDTGTISITNPGQDYTLTGYSLRSSAGGLSEDDWVSIAGNYDAGGDQSVSSDVWNIITESNIELAEGTFGTGTIAASGSIDLGMSWRRSPFEDVTFELLDDSGNVVQANVVYVGTALAEGDFNVDGAVTPLDWPVVRDGMNLSFPGVTEVDGYFMGDLTGDFAVNRDDYLRFEELFDAANGDGAFARMIPEPRSLVLFGIGGLALISFRRRLALVHVVLLVSVGLTVTVGNLSTAEDFFPISSVSSSTEATDLWAVSNLIQGPGVGFDAVEPHDKTLTGEVGNWVTDAPGGFPADYIAVAGAPVISLDLGQDRLLSEISVWGYDSGNANGTSEFDLGFATQAEGPGGGSVTVGPFPLAGDLATGMNEDTLRQSFSFAPVTARYVEFTALDNFFVAPGDGSGGELAGGDRVGLGEIAFADTSSGRLALEVDLGTGSVTLQNDGDDRDIDYYEITSQIGSINVNGWNSLEDQDFEGNGPSLGDGNGWEEFANTSNQIVNEAYLQGSSVITGGGATNIDLGSLYAIGRAQDWEFSYEIEGGGAQIGLVNYVGMPGVSGDFNGDGSWDCADIDALVGEVAAGTNNPAFDMNGDGAVNAADVTDAVTGWLAVGGANNPPETGGNPFLTGDANLDGVVDVSDFNIWNGAKFTSVPEWCRGDFTADGSIDVSDFNQWNSNKFQSSSDGVSSVPEPSSVILLLAVLPFWLRRRRLWDTTINIQPATVSLGMLAVFFRNPLPAISIFPGGRITPNAGGSSNHAPLVGSDAIIEFAHKDAGDLAGRCKVPTQNHGRRKGLLF